MTIQLINFLETPYELQLETRNWRNSENVTQYFQLKHIPEDGHKKWLEKLTHKKPEIVAFFIKDNEEYVGVTYFHSINYDQKECDWGIYIHNTQSQGKGIGKLVLKKSTEYAHSILGIRTMFLEVLEKNTRAINLYEKFGFLFLEQKDNVVRYMISLPKINKIKL